MKRVARLDVGTTGAVERTPQGGIRVPAYVAKVGVLAYEDTEGRKWREFVPPETAFDPESLRTLRDSAVTDLHPPEMVTTENHGQLSKGHVADAVARDGIYVAAPLVIQDAALVAKVDSGERREISAGYTCDVEPKAGVWEGQAYDGIQRNRVYNHVAMLPPGAGRAGRDVALRLDGAAVQVEAPAGASMFIKIKGRKFRLDDAGELAEAQKTADEMGAELEKADDGDEEIADLKAKLEVVKEALTDALKAQAVAEAALAAKEAALAAATTENDAPVTEEDVPEEVQDAIAAKRIKLHEDARRVLGASAELPKTAKGIHEAVIRHHRPSVKLDALDAKTRTLVFDTIVETVGAARTAATTTTTNAALAALNSGIHQNAVAGARADGADDPVEAARLRLDSTTRAASTAKKG